MTAPKVLANTSIFDDVQLDNSYDATIHSNAAGDDASNSSLDESYSPSIADASAQVEAPNSAPTAELFHAVSLTLQTGSIDAGSSPGAQHDISADIGNDVDLSSVILAPLVFSTESNSSVAESVATDAGDIAGVLDLSDISPNLVPDSDLSTFVVSPSGELTGAADASVSSGWLGVAAAPETGFAGTLDSNGSVPSSNFAFALASPEPASPGFDFAVPTANLPAFEAPAPADQGGTSPTLPQGIVEVGDLGAFSATLAHANSLGAGESGGESGGSLQATSGEQSSGLIINITWDSSVNNAPAAFKSVVESVVQFYESEFSNPVTLNIDVGWGEVAGSNLQSGSLGESESFVEPFSYSQILSALTQNVSSNAQLAAVNSLPSSAPGSGDDYLSLAEATALGLRDRQHDFGRCHWLQQLSSICIQ